LSARGGHFDLGKRQPGQLTLLKVYIDGEFNSTVKHLEFDAATGGLVEDGTKCNVQYHPDIIGELLKLANSKSCGSTIAIVNTAPESDGLFKVNYGGACSGDDARNNNTIGRTHRAEIGDIVAIKDPSAALGFRVAVVVVVIDVEEKKPQMGVQYLMPITKKQAKGM
jgi:hypothetical protein